MISIIDKWFGRTGNNFIQIINCIYYSFYKNNCNRIIFPKHNLFKINIILNKEDKKIDKSERVLRDSFFYAKKLGFTLEPYQMRQIAQKYITDIINIDLDYKDEDNDLYIHVRAGDIMRSRYFFLLPNPLKLYKRIIDENRYDNIHIIYENTENPVINKLKSLNNSKLKFQSLSIREDIEKLCKGKHLLMCFSTFSLVIYFLSKNLEHILIPKFMIDEWYPNMKWGLKMTVFDFENYSIESWKKMTKREKEILLLEYDGEINNI